VSEHTPFAAEPPAQPTASEPTAPEPTAPEPTAPVPPAGTSTVTDLADGEWHRLHPATPLFRGGIAFIAIIGVIIVNLRDRILELWFGYDDIDTGPGGDFEADAIDFLVREELIIVALLAALGVLLLLVAGFYFSWRMHTFRITGEAVEVRSGILFRTNRKGRLDRIQGINVGRPFVPRLFGAAKLEISVAGNDANVQLAYLRSRDADALRRDILLLASGARRESAASTSATAAHAGIGGILDERVHELLAPELDVELTEPKSIVRLSPGRLIGSTFLSETFIILVLMLVAIVVSAVLSGELFLLFAMLPGLIGIGGFLFARITRSLRYSIASTPDGVRVGFGLLSTTNETLPPGRIHSVRVSQPLLWRPFGWWQIAVNRASRSSQNGAAGQQQTTILPVGSLDDVRAVLGLLLPEAASAERQALLEQALLGSGPGEGGEFTVSPPRARILRWFSRRRNGFALSPEAVLLRTGAIWRGLVVVPFPRLQSVSVHQGPLLRALRLASVHAHTVAGPISPTLGALDVVDAGRFFDEVAASALRAAQADTSHRWRAEHQQHTESAGAASTAEAPHQPVVPPETA